MLGKLLKYEYKATARQFLPLFGALFIMAIINRILGGFGEIDHSSTILNFSTGASMMLYVTLIVVMYALTFFVMIQRFNKNLLGDEGYLMHTLPAPMWTQVFSKMIVSVSWIFLSVIAMMASLGIVVYGVDIFMEIGAIIREFWMIFVPNIGPNEVIVMIEFLLVALASSGTAILFIYLCLSIGQLFSKRRTLAAFGAYLGLTTLFQFITLFAAEYLPYDMLENLFNYNTYGMAHFWMISMFLITIFMGALCYFGINYILTKKLNLE